MQIHMRIIYANMRIYSINANLSNPCDFVLIGDHPYKCLIIRRKKQFKMKSYIFLTII